MFSSSISQQQKGKEEGKIPAHLWMACSSCWCNWERLNVYTIQTERRTIAICGAGEAKCLVKLVVSLLCVSCLQCNMHSRSPAASQHGESLKVNTVILLLYHSIQFWAALLLLLWWTWGWTSLDSMNWNSPSPVHSNRMVQVVTSSIYPFRRFVGKTAAAGYKREGDSRDAELNSKCPWAQ